MIYIIILLFTSVAVGVTFLLKRKGYVFIHPVNQIDKVLEYIPEETRIERFKQELHNLTYNPIEADCLHKETVEFPNGTPIYLVKSEYIMAIKCERSDVIEDFLNMIAFIGVDIETLKTGQRNIQEASNTMALKPYEPESLVARDNIHKITNAVIEYTPQVLNFNKDMLRKMFCMFYCLDGEDWRSVNPEMDKKKIELLEAYPHLQSFFFQRLEQVTKPLSITLHNAILIASQSLLIKSRITDLIKDLKVSIPPNSSSSSPPLEQM